MILWAAPPMEDVPGEGKSELNQVFCSDSQRQIVFPTVV